MIDFSKLEKIAEYRNGELQWLEGRDINAVYVILVGDEYYIGSSHYTYLRIGQHVGELEHGHHHSQKLQDKFNEVGIFDVYSLDRGIERHKLQVVEFGYIEKYKPTLNIKKPKGSEVKHRIKELLIEKRLTSAALSEMIGLSRVSLSNIINNKQEASTNTLKRIADGLGVAFWELFESREDIINQDKTHITCPKCGARFKLEE